MTNRSGMNSLVQRLRQMTEAKSEEYTIEYETYWRDDQLVEALDETRQRLTGIELKMEPEFVNSNYIYKRYIFPGGIKAVEGTVGGTDYFRVYDSNGTTIAASGYAFYDRDLSVEFTADQDGSARYWSGYAYDMQAAAREVWLRKAAHVHRAINFSADGASFNRDQLYQHCMDMAKVYGYGGRVSIAKMKRSDLNASGEDHF